MLGVSIRLQVVRIVMVDELFFFFFYLFHVEAKSVFRVFHRSNSGIWFNHFDFIEMRINKSKCVEFSRSKTKKKINIIKRRPYVGPKTIRFSVFPSHLLVFPHSEILKIDQRSHISRRYDPVYVQMLLRLCFVWCVAVFFLLLWNSLIDSLTVKKSPWVIYCL